MGWKYCAFSVLHMISRHFYDYLARKLSDTLFTVLNTQNEQRDKQN